MFVAATGGQTAGNCGTDSTTPCALQNAIDNEIAENDVLFLASGQYDMYTQANAIGFEKSNIGLLEIQGESEEGTILFFSSTIFLPAISHVVHILAVNQWTVRNLTMIGGPDYRAVELTHGGSLIMEGVTIRNFTTGAITVVEGSHDIPAKLIVKGCTFEQNSIDDTDSSRVVDGGAIRWEGAGEISITASDFRGNTASGVIASDSSASTPHGGAISIISSVDLDNSLNVTIERCLFESNSCRGLAFTAGAWGGGALYSKGYSNLRLLENKFLSNTCNYNGGAVFISRDRIQSLEMRSILFEGNDVSETGSEHGGALFLGSHSSMEMRLSDLVFRNNTARTRGGAIYVNPSQSPPPQKIEFLMQDSAFLANAAASGAAVHIEQSYVELNFTRPVFCRNWNRNSGTDRKSVV